ncbi:hypothetical protein Q8A73_001879 [Channa argus]|nr:hypothetical protein Q8A73_001879 [Channa argus]
MERGKQTCGHMDRQWRSKKKKNEEEEEGEEEEEEEEVEVEEEEEEEEGTAQAAPMHAGWLERTDKPSSGACCQILFWPLMMWLRCVSHALQKPEKQLSSSVPPRESDLLILSASVVAPRRGKLESPSIPPPFTVLGGRIGDW